MGKATRNLQSEESYSDEEETKDTRQPAAKRSYNKFEIVFDFTIRKKPSCLAETVYYTANGEEDLAESADDELDERSLSIEGSNTPYSSIIKQKLQWE